MHRSPDLEASRAVTDHHASSCITKKRAPGAQPALPPVLAEAFVSGFAAVAWEQVGTQSLVVITRNADNAPEHG